MINGLRLRLRMTRWQVDRVPETGSTNADVAAAARAGAAEGLVVAADHQTAGRGRLGRSWDTPREPGWRCRCCCGR